MTLVHDVIPHQSIPNMPGHRGRMNIGGGCIRSIGFASGIIGNSQATIDALAPHMASGLAGRVVRVAHFGADAVDIFGGRGESLPDRPYFVYISTIEPAQESPAPAHHLAAAGRATGAMQPRCWC